MTPAVGAALSSVGARFRRARLEDGLRLADVAAMSGLSETLISRIESGERLPSLPAFLTLADVYGRDPASLVRDPDVDVNVVEHEAGAVWEGPEEAGSGLMTYGETHIPFDRSSRLTAAGDGVLGEHAPLASPEALIAMAFSGCYSMSLTRNLADDGYEPVRVQTDVGVRLETSAEAIGVTLLTATCRATVPRIRNARFQEIAFATKRTCVMALVLAAVPIRLDAVLTRKR